MLEESNRADSFQCKRGPEEALLFSELGLADVRQKAGMGRAAMGVVGTSLVQAEGAVHRQANLGGVHVFLAVVLPPADRAKGQRAGRVQCLASAARAAIMSSHGFPQTG